MPADALVLALAAAGFHAAWNLALSGGAASATPGAAVRETSVVIAVALAAPLLGENVGARRLAGAALIVIGVAVLGAA